jgi:glutathione S-transferase
MYELYYAHHTASLSVHWVLVHLELAYSIQHKTHLLDFTQTEQKSDSYLALNPKGRVPTLITPSSEPLTESPAILLYLAESHPEARLAPDLGGEHRAKYLETMMVLANSLLPALRDWVYAGKDGPGGPAAEAVKDLSAQNLGETWDLLDQQLEGREWLVGDRVGVADFLVVSVTGWMKSIEDEACKRKNVKRLVQKMKEREDWKEVVKREDGEKAKRQQA